MSIVEKIEEMMKLIAKGLRTIEEEAKDPKIQEGARVIRRALEIAEEIERDIIRRVKYR